MHWVNDVAGAACASGSWCPQPAWAAWGNRPLKGTGCTSFPSTGECNKNKFGRTDLLNARSQKPDDVPVSGCAHDVYLGRKLPHVEQVAVHARVEELDSNLPDLIQKCLEDLHTKLTLQSLHSTHVCLSGVEHWWLEHL